ncbi:ImuA family protein [Planctomycetaceae bacterium SH139]
MAINQLELWPSEEIAVEEVASEPPVASEPLSAAAEARQLVASLRRQVTSLETATRATSATQISCGCAVLDAMLPGGGLAPGTLNEWVEQEPGGGGGWLSLLAARSALLPTTSSLANSSVSLATGQMVILDLAGTFYPPAAAAAGIPTERMIVVRPANRADALWAADQALRNPAVTVVWGHLERLDDREARRLQLAAELGNTLGLWLRPRVALNEPSWAEVRWHVRSLPGNKLTANHFSSGGETSWPPVTIQRRLEARLVRCRGGRSGASVVLDIDSGGRVHHASNDQQTAALPLVAQLARPTSDRQQPQRRLA